MPMYKVLLQGLYGDMGTFHDVVEADNEIEALFLCDGAFCCFDEECWDEDTGDLNKDKLPKTIEEASKMAYKHDRRIEVRLKH